MRTNFEKTMNKTSHLSEEARDRIRKRGKTVRGGGVKGAFRGSEGQDSLVNQEKYFVGV